MKEKAKIVLIALALMGCVTIAALLVIKIGEISDSKISINNSISKAIEI